MRRVIILGSTGSIGVQALRVIACSTDLMVAGLSCDRNVALLLEQAMSLGVADIAIADEGAAATVNPSLFPELRVRAGRHAAARLVREVEADIVLNSIVGFAGLESTVAAIDSARTLALANKESLVCAGALVTASVERSKVALVPVDSEHSALYQLMASAGLSAVTSVIITASGGPFFGKGRAELASVSCEEALAHPTWSMGRKITVDSATLMNKGLEVIEAHHLFRLPYEAIEVIIHPQSVVHAMVRMVDGALLAHLGVADMRVPIAFALRYPSRGWLDTAPLDLAACGRLEFAQVDELTFPAVHLARAAGAMGDRATCALNAANEVAVAAFLGGALRFMGITEVVEEVLCKSNVGDFGTYEEVESVDMWAREIARHEIEIRR
ncbi:MAG: 1-deoxy-D-xylulose-5-phosphate reductoisomerase [Actinobacteria bacterium]|nr:1-deoxy-D-xylulose-5-phosphate reductoisomerase [Actinomycetota bacterium]